MSPKSKAAPAKAAKAEKVKAPAKASKKSSKEEEVVAAAPVNPDDAEDEEEAAAASSSGGGGGHEAALAAATAGGGEMSASFKNFRHHPDMENFYRFIFENDLRIEALTILNQMMNDKIEKKLAKQAGGKGAH